MYLFKNIYSMNKIKLFTNNKSINDESSIKIINQCNADVFLNTGKQIYKKILDINKKFIHIHPGFLPEIKGADGSLWHIKEQSNIGVSSFIMDKKIDEGAIIERENYYLAFFAKKLRKY